MKKPVVIYPLIDLGDGIALTTFQRGFSRMNDAFLEMLILTMEKGFEKFDALVISNGSQQVPAVSKFSWMLESAGTGNGRK